MSFYSFSKKYPFIRRTLNRMADAAFLLVRGVVPVYKDDGPVLIISLHKMGDTVFTIPAVKAIFKYYDSKVLMMTFRDNIPIYKIKFPGMRFIQLDRNNFLFSGRFADKTARQLVRELKPSKIIDITGSIITASLLLSSGCPDITGISEPQYRKIYNRFVPISFNKHLSEIYLNVASAIGIDISLTAEEEKEISESRNNRILIFPLAGWRSKEWGLNNFIDVADKLKEAAPVSFVVPASGLDSDIIEDIRMHGIDVIETQSVEDMIEVIRDSSLVICNDSGPSYVAELLGKKNITLFGPVNPGMHKIPDSISIIISERIACSPINTKLCFANGGKDCPNNVCMAAISIDRVLKAAGWNG